MRLSRQQLQVLIENLLHEARDDARLQNLNKLVATIFEKWINATFQVAKDSGASDELINTARKIDIAQELMNPDEQLPMNPEIRAKLPYVAAFIFSFGGSDEDPDVALIKVIEAAYGDVRKGGSALKSSLQSVINQNTRGSAQLNFDIVSNPSGLETFMYFYL